MMDEDQIGSDASDKRRVDDESPKPNPKRIKLVRPVFSTVAKPSFSPIEPNKSDVQPTEVLRSGGSSDTVTNLAAASKTPEKSDDQLEISKSPIDRPETGKIPKEATPLVSEVQVDSGSDALDEKDIFSEETKKELEDLKKNIFKIEDDGSSSENDGQSKRPRLKRPTFVTSTVDNKFESNDTKSLDRPNEVLKLDLVKPTCEDTTNKIDDALEKPIVIQENVNKFAENDGENKNINKVLNNGNNEDKIEKKLLIVTEHVEKELVEKSVIENVSKNIGIESIQNVEEKLIESESVIKTNSMDKTKDSKNIGVENIKNVEEKLIEPESVIKTNIMDKTKDSKNIGIENIKNVEEKLIEPESIIKTNSMDKDKEFKDESDRLCEVMEMVTELVKDIKGVQKASQIDTNVLDTSVDNKMKSMLFDKETLTAKEQNNKNDLIVEKVILKRENEESISEKNVDIKIDQVQSNFKEVLERFDKTSNNKRGEKLMSSVKPQVKNEDKTIISETIHNDLTIEGAVKLNLNNEKSKIKSNSETDEIKNTQVYKTVKSVKDDDEVFNLEIEQNSNISAQVNSENKYICDTLSKEKPTKVVEEKHEEFESLIFKSDILKAALMSKKSPESPLNSLEVHEDQPSANIYPSTLETIKVDVLPKTGQEDFVNKIEAESNELATKDQSTNNKKSQNKIVSEMPKINSSNEVSSSVCLNKNINVDKTDELPKWGSAKMNEVEKFLNDSNVTITPICKSQDTPKLGKITLKLPKIGNPEIKSEITVRPDVKSELIKKITNKQNAMGDSPLKSALSQPSKSFSDFATIRPAPKPSAEQIALLEQQILNTPKKRGRPSKALAQQKQLLLQYQQQQQQQQQNVQEGNVEDEPVFHVPLFDMEDMSGGAGMFDSFDASTPKRGKSIRGKGSRGRRGRGGGGQVRVHDGSDSDTPSNNCHINNEGDIFKEEINQQEETKQVAMIEAERLRKEEERERKLEARKKKIKERYDAIKEKKMKKKLKAEERRLQWHEKKKRMQEEKARAAEMKKSLPPPQNFDDETRMSADCNNSRSQTPARNFMFGEDDLSISGTTNDSFRLKKGRMEVIDFESNKTLTVDQIAEYQWPLQGGELCMIQEQISNFLGVKSFKRKYPGLKRRNVEAEERTFLCDSGLVAESLCDLGLTVLYSSEVLDVMYADFPEKYEELREYMRLKHAKELSNRQRALTTISSNTDGSKLDLRDRAMEAAANWNVNFNKSRLESRKCSMDMQTFIVHYPKLKCKKMAIAKPKIGNYPLALLPGQFCDYYATYSSKDLRYLPMNTVLYGPLKSIDKDFPVSLSSQSESEDSSSDDSSDSDDSIDIDNKLGKSDLECGPSDKKGAECKLCVGTSEKNKNGIAEPLIHCSKCLTIYHPTCLDMTVEMVPYIKRYNWQCNECKYCAQCKEVADEDKMLFCDLCDRGYHIYCVGLRKVPEGRWHCQECAMCNSCGISDPGPGDSKWYYEFKKVEKTGSKIYCRTLCAPCSRLWKKGHYCPNCMRCYPIKNIERMTQCNSCDRYLHSECLNENVPNGQVVTCSVCEEKAVSRLLTTVPRSLIKV